MFLFFQIRVTTALMQSRNPLSWSICGRCCLSTWWDVKLKSVFLFCLTLSRITTDWMNNYSYYWIWFWVKGYWHLSATHVQNCLVSPVKAVSTNLGQKWTVSVLINGAVDMVLKSARFSQILCKQLVSMATWQTTPCRGCPRGSLLAHASCMTQICHFLLLRPCLVLVERLAFLHSNPVSD